MEQGIQLRFGRIDATIYEYGCYFLDLVRWAELDNNIEFGVNEVVNLYNTCKKLEYIGNECYILKAHEIYNAAAGTKKYTGVSIIKPPVGKNDSLLDTYIICNKKPMYTHFTLCYKGKIWDSLPPERNGAAAYKLSSYRVLI